MTDPNEIKGDDDAEDTIESIIGGLEDMKTPLENKDYVTALEIADEVQDLTNRLHAYISGKIDNG